MRTSVTAQGPTLASQLEPRFGRAKYVIVEDTDAREIITYNNRRDLDAHIFGIETAQNVCCLDVEAVITGDIGPNAFTTVNACEIDVFLSNAESCKEALDLLKASELKQADEAGVSCEWPERANCKQKAS